jgi:multiple sugar transport system substrate-binding protein
MSRYSREEFLALSAKVAAAGSLALAAGPYSALAAGTTSIRFSIWYGQGDIDVWKKVISNFQRANRDISVKFEPVDYGQFWTKLNTQFAGGTAPDVMGMQFNQQVYGPEGQLEPLDTYMKRGQIGQIPKPLVQDGQWPAKNPKQYALPWRFVGASLFANMDALKKAGVAYPKGGWSLDEFVHAAKKLTRGQQYGLAAPDFSMGTNLASTFGAQPVSNDGKKAMYNTPEMLAYKTFVHDLIFKHKVAPRFRDMPQHKDPFASGMVAMIFQGTWQIPVDRQVKGFNWDILPNPNGKKAAKNYAGPDQISIWAHSQQKEAAWRFVQYVVFDLEAQKLIATTGAPVLLKYLEDQKRIEAETAQKPAHYRYFIEEAVTHGEGWGFVPAFAQIGTLEIGADDQIMNDPHADIKAVLDKLNQQVQTLLNKTNP